MLAIAPSMPSQGRIRRGRHGQLPQIPGTLQIEELGHRADCIAAVLDHRLGRAAEPRDQLSHRVRRGAQQPAPGRLPDAPAYGQCPRCERQLLGRHRREHMRADRLVGIARWSTSCGMVMRSSASLASSPLSIVTAVQRRPAWLRAVTMSRIGHAGAPGGTGDMARPRHRRNSLRGTTRPKPGCRALPPALLHRLIVLAGARTRIGRLGVPTALEKEAEAATTCNEFVVHHSIYGRSTYDMARIAQCANQHWAPATARP